MSLRSSQEAAAVQQQRGLQQQEGLLRVVAVARLWLASEESMGGGWEGHLVRVSTVDCGCVILLATACNHLQPLATTCDAL